MKNETFQNDFQKFRYFIFKAEAAESRKYHTFKNFAVSPN